jgi:uncharacterized protein (TIGR00251 family)
VTTPLPPWLRLSGSDLILHLHVQPGAKKTEIAGSHGEALKIRLNAPPVDGKANDGLIVFLADRLALPKTRLILEAGQTSRSKRVRILGLAAEVVVMRLG